MVLSSHKRVWSHISVNLCKFHSYLFLSIARAELRDIMPIYCDSCFAEAAVFFNNVKKSVKELDDTAGPLLEQKEKLILQVVLPWLEESWRKPDSSRQVVYESLAEISRSRASPKVVSHTLRQLHRLMLFDTLDSGQSNLLSVEEIVRLSICSSDAVFQKEGVQEKELRLSVYRHIIALLIFQRIKGWFFAVDIVKKKLLELQYCLAKYTNHEKCSFQFSIVFIQEAIRYLLKPREKSEKSNVRTFLNECRANIEKQVVDGEKLSFLDKLRNPRWVKKMKRKKIDKHNWLAVHCVILYFYEKVCKTLLISWNFCHTITFLVQFGRRVIP